jgi:hypothetical protein
MTRSASEGHIKIGVGLLTCGNVKAVCGERAFTAYKRSSVGRIASSAIAWWRTRRAALICEEPGHRQCRCRGHLLSAMEARWVLGWTGCSCTGLLRRRSTP